MTAPDRHNEVAAAFVELGLTEHPEVPGDEPRRQNLFAVIRYLNRLDNGKWGALRKDDQGGKIPADILVWRDTLEHFDIIAGATGKPRWDPYGPIGKPYGDPRVWHWHEVPALEPPDNPPPEPDPDPQLPLDATELAAAIRALTQEVRTASEEVSRHTEAVEELALVIREGVTLRFKIQIPDVPS
jgi:hypothetical protein